MRSRFDDSEVVGWQALDGSYGLPDADDEHVVAAAVVGGAGVIVTHNVKDFPRERLPPDIEVQRPADFAHTTVSLNPAAARRALEHIANRSGRRGSVRTVDGLLALLEGRYGFTDAVAAIRAHQTEPH